MPSTSKIIDKPEGMCPVDWALSVTAYAVHENCGRSVICRDGIKQIHTIIKDITEDRTESSDLELLRDLCVTLKDYGDCDLTYKAADLVLISMDKYSDEWDKHVKRKRCTALVCKKYYTVHIDPAKCKGNGACIAVCPEGAIKGGEGLISVVDNEKCTRCGKCFDACSECAVIKAGAIKPRVPEEPVPVGSVGDGDDGAGRRRRRRG